MKAYYNSGRTKRMFYDNSIRFWTMLEIDLDGNQIVDAAYHASRRIAFAWLAWKVNESKAASGGCTHGGH